MPLGELAPPNLTRTHVLPLLEYLGAAAPAEAAVTPAAPTDGDGEGGASTAAEPLAAPAGAPACTPVCALLQAPLLALWWRLFPSAEAEGLAGYPPSVGAGGLAAARLLALLKEP